MTGTQPENGDLQTDEMPWPVEIRLKSDRKTLQVSYEDGTTDTLEAEYLRVYSPSAEIKGHGGEPRKIIGGKRGVRIIGLDTVGNYAVRISFDDLHNTGLYSWPYLAALARDADANWAAYEDDLKSRGMSRDP